MGCPPSPPSVVTVSTNAVNLSQSSPCATVTVINSGGGTLSWTATSNDASVVADPSESTGKSQVVTMSADDFSAAYTAQVTFTNDDDASNWEVVEIIVAGSGGPVTPGEMVSMGVGTFEMGDPWAEWAGDELPVHLVTLSAYEIGKYEVTNQEYADMLNWANTQGYLVTANSTTVDAYGVQLLNVDDSNCQISWNGSLFEVDTRDAISMTDHPVIMVSWYGAAAYCNWLSESQSLQPCYNTSTWDCDFSKDGYHLPTEAQWERAAAWNGSYHYRYGNGSDSISCVTANHYNGSDYCNPLGLSINPNTSYTSPVGYYTGASSPAGCYDMSGNVWEWCNDWSKRVYTSSPVTDPEGPGSGTVRVIRGGSWINFDDGCRSALRSHSTYLPTFTIGFRLAR